VVKDEPVDEPAGLDMRGKLNIVDDVSYNFFQYYDRNGCRRRR
jgi:hypothetical protein